MSYTINFRDQSVDPIGKLPITVLPGSVESTLTPLSFTGKGASNYGELQQENLLHLLENFASPTPPPNATIGQVWYDSVSMTLKILTDSAPQVWKSVGGSQVTGIGAAPPSPAAVGDMWFATTGLASGYLYVYTGLGRYPTTATTIGGWEQFAPAVQTFAGRDEYDTVRELLEQIAGEGISSYGSGAIGRSITNLTNFAALDLDLRTKYKAITGLSGDSNVLISPSSDFAITKQALSSTLFFHADGSSANDAVIAGSASNAAAPGSILIDGVSTVVPSGIIDSNSQVEDAFIMWDRFNSLGAGFVFHVVRQSGSTWERESGASWVPLTPALGMYVIGTISSFQADNNSVRPGNKNGFMYAHAVPLLGAKIEHLKVEPNAQDWDALLAAAKYAIDRLEVPKTFIENVSPVPFVYDGMPAPASLTALPSTDVRYPTGVRRSNRKVGIVSQVQQFSETINALRTAIANRFSLRGINGNTGTNPAFRGTTSITPHASHSPTISGGVSTSSLALRFANPDELSRWMTSGQGVQISLTHVGGALIGDTNLRTLLSTVGTFRGTADKTRIFGQSLPLTITRSTANAGLWNAIGTGKLLTTQTIGVSTVSVTVYRYSTTRIDVQVNVDAGSALSGVLSVSYSLIDDTEVAGAVQVFPSPEPFVAGDLT